MLYDIIHNYMAILKKMLYGEEHVNTVHVYMQDGVFLVKLDCGSFWVLQFLFCLNATVLVWRFFFHLWTDNVRTQQFSQTHHACASLSDMWYGLSTTSVGACGVGVPSSHWFSPENLLLGSPSFQHAVGWPVHTWTFPLVPPPWYSFRTIILLWQWQSQLTLCARDTE